ncbi:DUF4390 domain-containing protein [Halochromatium salexigens]|nr:DUF4390 domain-containing protein [Halochromatium salexigens]
MIRVRARARPWRWPPALLACVALTLSLVLNLLPSPMARAADGFHVIDAKTRRVDGKHILSAEIDYRFSERALEALENGVPLTIQVHLQVREQGAWIWDESLVDRRLRYRIRYKPLSERYLVSRLPSEDGRIFVTRQAAIAALGELNDLHLISAHHLDPQQAYEVHLRASLDIEELPLPLRPMAYLRAGWKQSTGWTRWPLTP